jgi:Ca2+-binding RTX toxin-like protein
MAQLLGTRSHDLFELKGTVGNIVYGYAGDDDFFDSIGNDWLRGGAGRDQFYSASGSDVMIGGIGDDEFHLSHGEANILIRGGPGIDDLVIPEALLAEGEADYLRYVYDGIMLQLADGGVLDIKGVELVTLV